MIAFSVIIPLYNKEKTIRDTLESVLRQSYPHFELVVVDDGSTDRSAEIVDAISDTRIRLFRKENGGPSAARNFGVQNARNFWILFLDADDNLLEDALSTFAQAILAHPHYAVFTANFYCIQGRNRRIFSENYPDGAIRKPFKEWFLRRLMPRAGACILQNDIAQAYPFKVHLRRSEDAELMFNIFRSVPLFRIETPVMEYHLDQNTESQNRSSINRDFQGHLNFDGKKSLWERICLYELYVEAKNNYPAEVNSVYLDMERHFMLKIAYLCAFWYRALRRKFKK